MRAVSKDARHGRLPEPLGHPMREQRAPQLDQLFSDRPWRHRNQGQPNLPSEQGQKTERCPITVDVNVSFVGLFVRQSRVGNVAKIFSERKTFLFIIRVYVQHALVYVSSSQERASIHKQTAANEMILVLVVTAIGRFANGQGHREAIFPRIQARIYEDMKKGRSSEGEVAFCIDASLEGIQGNF